MGRHKSSFLVLNNFYQIFLITFLQCSAMIHFEDKKLISSADEGPVMWFKNKAKKWTCQTILKVVYINYKYSRFYQQTQ